MARIFENLGTSSFGCEVIVSDMAPKTTGISDMDHENIVALCYAALGFALKTLKPRKLSRCSAFPHQRRKAMQKYKENYNQYIMKYLNTQ